MSTKSHRNYVRACRNRQLAAGIRRAEIVASEQIVNQLDAAAAARGLTRGQWLERLFIEHPEVLENKAA
jgi:hypothetical protein